MTNKRNKSFVQRFLIVFIHFYQTALSPYFGGQCRFYPSCSQYAILSIQKDGAIKGILKSGWRILRCNPLNGGGIDYP